MTRSWVHGGGSVAFIQGCHGGDTSWHIHCVGLTQGTVGSQASCHQRIALICDDVQAKITQIFSFVSLSYRLLAVDEDDGTPLCVRRPNTLDQSGIDEHKPSDCPSQKSCLRRTKILSRIGSVHRAFSRAPYTGMWLLKNPAVLKISEVACTRSGKGPANGTLSGQASFGRF